MEPRCERCFIRVELSDDLGPIDYKSAIILCFKCEKEINELYKKYKGKKKIEECVEEIKKVLICHICRKKSNLYKDPLDEGYPICLICYPLEDLTFKEQEELSLCVRCQYPQFKNNEKEFAPNVRGHKITIYTKRKKFRYNVKEHKIITYHKRKEKIIFFTNNKQKINRNKK